MQPNANNFCRTYCLYRPKCTKECELIKTYLEKENKKISHKFVDSKNIIALPAHSKESRFCELNEVQVKKVESNQKSPFRNFNPNLKKTGIFIDRFFLCMSYEEMAVKYDCSQAVCRSFYQKALQKIIKIIIMLDKNPRSGNQRSQKHF